jgi:PST family polysaccharide transporter
MNRAACSSAPGRAEPDTAKAAPVRSYDVIVRSSAVVAGGQLLSMLISLVRTKALAVMLGPSGVGLMGALSALIDLARTLSGLGASTSGVRNIAEAASRNDELAIRRTTTLLVGLVFAFGVLGALALWAFATPIALVTFASADHAVAVAVVGVAVLLGLLSEAFNARLQGERRLGDYAIAGVVGSLLGTVLAIGIVRWQGADGVALALVAIAGALAASTGWFASRRGRLFATLTEGAVPMRRDVSALLALGLAFMVSSVMVMGANYIVRMIVIREEGLDAAGLYQAAWTIAGLYVGVLLQAMGADFYPRLVGVANDSAACNRMVNEQAQAGVLLACAGVLATITFAPLLVTVLYSNEFAASAQTLRWIALGMAMRIVTWPLGYILVSRQKTGLFVATDLICAVANVALTWLLVRSFGLPGVGLAFLGAYLVHFAVVYPLARRLTGFRWSGQTLRTIVGFAVCLALALTATESLPSGLAMIAGSVLTVASALYALHVLRGLRAWDGLFKRLGRFGTGRPS